MSRQDENPTTGEMVNELLDLLTGFGVLTLPLMIMAIPALILLVPIALLAIPLVLLAPPFLLIRAARRLR
jgi:hypothetical protein